MNLCIDQQTKKKVDMIQPDSRKYFSQLIVTYIHTLSIFPSVHDQLIRTLFEGLAVEEQQALGFKPLHLNGLPTCAVRRKYKSSFCQRAIKYENKDNSIYYQTSY